MRESLSLHTQGSVVVSELVLAELSLERCRYSAIGSWMTWSKRFCAWPGRRVGGANDPLDQEWLRRQCSGRST
jgi:hypothetical protein